MSQPTETKTPAWGRDAPICRWRNGPYDCESIEAWWNRLESWSKPVESTDSDLSAVKAIPAMRE